MNEIDKPLLRRELPDGRLVELWRMLFTFRITITSPQNDGICWDDAWCFTDGRLSEAVFAFQSWDGEGEPVGWNKHPVSGRWRPDGTEATEINQRDDAPPEAGAL